MKYLLLTLMLSLTGCSGFPPMGNGIPADAIIMEAFQEVRVGSMSNKTDNGTHIDRFYCLEGLMVCRQYASQKYCSCESGEIWIPQIMR